MRTKTMISQIEKRREAIGRERDKLDDLISELQELKEDCQEAFDCLDDARDALSRTV